MPKHKKITPNNKRSLLPFTGFFFLSEENIPK
jgi:hypothetical protein